MFTDDEIGSVALGNQNRLKFKNSAGVVKEVTNLDDLNGIMKYGATNVVMNGNATFFSGSFFRFNIQAHNIGRL